VRSVRINGPGLVEVVEGPDLVPGVEDVVIDVAYAGICGSDFELFAGTRPEGFFRYPIVPGHEWSGTVRQVGAEVDQSLIGRKAVGQGFTSCGKCSACLDEMPMLCERGYDEIGFTRDGAWSEQLVIEADHLYLLDDNADLRGAAGLEPSSCSADAVELGGTVTDKRVAVIGAGTIGLLCVQLLAAMKPAELIVVEPESDRRGRASSFGATSTLLPEAAARGWDRFDLVIEAAGTGPAVQLAVELARPGGRVVLTGIPGGGDTLSIADLVTKRLEVLTVFGGTSHGWDRAVRAFGDGQLDPALLVSHEIPLVDALDALELLSSTGSGSLKILLRP
jgi:2-desacetyl-2-hydroxyethyl bacteriochlorophyllide A dehydrogenase